MKLLQTTIFILCFAYYCSGQGYSIKGNVKDTLNNANLPLSSIVLINAKDSIITSFTRTDSIGNFSLSVDKQGKYMLRITFPSFADYVEPINISKPVTDVGMIAMVTKEHLLKEFVLTKEISAIKIKGDTTEYVADSFKVKENANVEALLKRLPGIQVDKNGQITAQGETVQKILVDGEEFFSDDPKVVTKGLQANIIDKVQVYDKKSDQAEFTGIDDGQKIKTINLQLKEDKKKGYFGKIDAGGGTDGYYQNEDMINAFKGKRQLSVFGIASNTDKVGLGWQDNGKFGAGNEMITDEDGNTYSTGSGSDGFGNWNGTYNGQGLPTTLTGGAHFADKWDEDKNHVTGNYRYGQQEVGITGDATTQYALPGDTSNVSTTHKTESSRGERHAIDGMYEWKIDSNNTLKVSASGGYKTTDVKSVFTTLTSLHTLTADDPLYTNNRTIQSNTTANFLNAKLLYKKKFAKKGRTLSIDMRENYLDSKEDGHLNSIIIPDSLNPQNSVIDQAKSIHNSTLAFYSKATYTEPITKIMSVELNYAATINNATSKNYSLNKDATGQYDAIDSLYSSNYKYNILSNSGGLNFRWVYKKTNFYIGSNVSSTNYLQTDLFHSDSSIRYKYLNFSPHASFKYKISNQRSFNFNYNGNTQQPTITQIQPLRQNADPTNITVGNPNLKQEFINRFGLSYNDYKVLTGRWLYASMNTSFINNAIGTSQNNSEGINTTRYVNVNGNYTANMWAGGGFKLKKTDMNVGFDLSPGLNHSNSFINGQKNTNDDNSYDVGVSLSKYKEDKYEFSFRPSITYYDNHATISTYSTNYWQSNSEVSGSVQLPKKFEIGTEVNFMFRERTPVFTTNNNVIKWNAYASKKFLKKQQLELKLSVFDILNQNIGFDRNATGSIITQNSYNTIRRYGMISLIWNFTHRPGDTAAPEETK